MEANSKIDPFADAMLGLPLVVESREGKLTIFSRINLWFVGGILSAFMAAVVAIGIYFGVPLHFSLMGILISVLGVSLFVALYRHELLRGPYMIVDSVRRAIYFPRIGTELTYRRIIRPSPSKRIYGEGENRTRVLTLDIEVLDESNRLHYVTVAATYSHRELDRVENALLAFIGDCDRQSTHTPPPS